MGTPYATWSPNPRPTGGTPKPPHRGRKPINRLWRDCDTGHVRGARPSEPERKPGTRIGLWPRRMDKFRGLAFGLARNALTRGPACAGHDTLGYGTTKPGSATPPGR